jgi:hypothetical protein
MTIGRGHYPALLIRVSGASAFAPQEIGRISRRQDERAFQVLHSRTTDDETLAQVGGMPDGRNPLSTRFISVHVLKRLSRRLQNACRPMGGDRLW